jgi:hypothetical protein
MTLTQGVSCKRDIKSQFCAFLLTNDYSLTVSRQHCGIIDQYEIVLNPISIKIKVIVEKTKQIQKLTNRSNRISKRSLGVLTCILVRKRRNIHFVGQRQKP